ncbi:MAG: hypothetical protein AWM53_01184 [Candidatus Dichloromethanomonas elyunquensis]|nr:MAG: hypothetical protein AWM53_01184 [Candidatus Dichloromethanomonas elyunquensis]
MRMRATIAIILGFLILISISAYLGIQIQHTAQTIQAELNQAEVLIHSNRWNEASALIDETLDDWSQAKLWWAIILNHNTLDTIEISYARLRQYTLNQETSHSLAELNTLMVLLENIPESESLRLNNIF